MQRGNALRRFARMRMRLFAVMSATAVVLGVAAVAPTGLAYAGGDDWVFDNQTSVPLWGEMHGQCGKTPPSDRVFDAGHALQPQEKFNMSQDCKALTNLYQWGRLCYDGHWWNLTREQPYNTFHISFWNPPVGGKRLIAQMYPSGSLVDMVRTDGCG
jgi:hypothetical protein